MIFLLYIYFLGDDPNELYEKEENVYPILVEELIEFNKNRIEKYGAGYNDEEEDEEVEEEAYLQRLKKRRKSRRMDQLITHEYPPEWWWINNDKDPPLCLLENRDLIKTERGLFLINGKRKRERRNEWNKKNGIE